MINDKIFFMPGDVVTLKQDIPDKPIMLVIKKETTIFKHLSSDKEPVLKGIKCRWFTKDHKLQEAVWNTKDLLKINK